MKLTKTQTRVIYLATMALGLSACSSPLKYPPRDNNATTSSVQEKHSQAQDCQGSYRVRSGDTLSEIAVKCDISMSQLAKYNQLLPPYIIYVNQELLIPSAQALQTSPELVDDNEDATNDITEQAKVESEPLQPKNKAPIKQAKQLSPPKEDSARAIERQETPQERVKMEKSGKWIWPMHKGLDYRYIRDRAGLSVLEIYGLPGQDVKAVTSGKVVYAGNGIANFGWMLVIKHTNEYMSIYAHNSALLVREGDIVKSGQVVATMGATGNTKRPKLYLEARYQGRKVDIKKILKP